MIVSRRSLDRLVIDSFFYATTGFYLFSFVYVSVSPSLSSYFFYLVLVQPLAAGSFIGYVVHGTTVWRSVRRERVCVCERWPTRPESTRTRRGRLTSHRLSARVGTPYRSTVFSGTLHNVRNVHCALNTVSIVGCVGGGLREPKWPTNHRRRDARSRAGTISGDPFSAR